MRATTTPLVARLGSALVGGALTALASATPGCAERAAGTPPSAQTTSRALPDAGAEPASRTALHSSPVPRIPLPLCGCALCEPVVSDDPCSEDADCAPASPCHAEACVAKAKAKPPTARTSCTMILRCDSVDANTCGCLAGRCALYPPKK